MADPVNTECPVDHEDQDDEGFGPFLDEQIWQHMFKNAFGKCRRSFQEVSIVFLLL
jgi:hypothetical protein